MRPPAPNAKDGFALILHDLSKDPATNQDLVAEVESLRARVCERLDAQRAARKADLQEQYNQVYAECRATLDRTLLLQQQVGEINSRLHGVQERLLREKEAVTSAYSRRPPAASYPTADETAAWQTEVATAEQGLADVENRYRAVVFELGRKQGEYQKASAELAELERKRKILEAQLNGRPYQDPDGLIVEPVSE
ncbi:MAG: hypothetical protein ACM336_03280 [Acidobacteriota bacterium]